MKRTREDTDERPLCRQKTCHDRLQSCKRKAEDDAMNQNKRMRIMSELDEARKRNRELSQCVDALLHKVASLEYMLQMFQRNETIGSNRLITSY